MVAAARLRLMRLIIGELRGQWYRSFAREGQRKAREHYEVGMKPDPLQTVHAKRRESVVMLAPPILRPARIACARLSALCSLRRGTWREGGPRARHVREPVGAIHARRRAVPQA